MIDRETVRLKYRNAVYIPLASRHLAGKLAVDDFTIISNNCWGGTIYEAYGLPKLTPTAGMFIMPDDYLSLVSRLPEYLELPLEFLDPAQSKWEPELGGKDNWGSYLIGRVGDVELHMLHYHDEREARRKWESRVGRVNFDRLIYKFNDQNGATDQQLARFDELELPNKVTFTVRDLPQLTSAVRVSVPGKNSFVPASYEPLRRARGFNVPGFINSCFVTS